MLSAFDSESLQHTQGTTEDVKLYIEDVNWAGAVRVSARRPDHHRRHARE
jgi:hypothetical protein